MPELLMLKGLPGSGKSTYAKSLKGYKRVNMDDLRQMLDDGKWSKANERIMQRVRKGIIWDLMRAGKNIVIDDTNLHSKHSEMLSGMVKEHAALAAAVTERTLPGWTSYANYTFKEHFVDTPVEECIKRDLQRQYSVGKDVIMRMYNQYLKPPAQDQEWDQSLPTCVLVDIDGTVAKMVNRGPYDWAKVGDDEPKHEIIELVEDLMMVYEIVFMSGRDGSCYEATNKWLQDNIKQCHYQLFMRAEGDSRKDSIVKQELYEEHIKGKYNVHLVLDDRDQVVRLWRDLGMTCLQVADGNF